MIVGLTGPTGSGKSQIINLIKSSNIFIIDCDKVSHNILNQNLYLYNELIANFSNIILDNNKKIDRKILGKIVFSDKLNLLKLNQIVFPYIKTEIINTINKYNSNFKVILLDAPTLIQSKLDRLCDQIIVVMANRKIRLNRILIRDNLTNSEANNRLNNQLSDDEYLKKANHVIYNNDDIDHLKKQVDKIFRGYI